jgi:hypothetical protein
LSETYQLHLLVLMRGQAYHFVIHFMPDEVIFASDTATNARGSLVMTPHLYKYSAGGQAQPLSGATAQHLNAESPRISCEVHFPPEIFEVPAFSKGMRLQMNIVVISHYRGQEMFFSEGTARKTFIRPEGWRAVTLGEP